MTFVVSQPRSQGPLGFQHGSRHFESREDPGDEDRCFDQQKHAIGHFRNINIQLDSEAEDMNRNKLR